MRRILDHFLVVGMVGILLYHIVSGWTLDWIVGIAMWGIAMCGLRVWKRHYSDRRSILDMAVIAIPALLFVAVVWLESITPALLVAVMACVRLAIPYTVRGVGAIKRVVQEV